MYFVWEVFSRKQKPLTLEHFFFSPQFSPNSVSWVLSSSKWWSDSLPLALLSTFRQPLIASTAPSLLDPSSKWFSSTVVSAKVHSAYLACELCASFASSKWQSECSTYLCTRGKSLLESWGTTFLPDWQPPLIFVWFTSKLREQYPH